MDYPPHYGVIKQEMALPISIFIIKSLSNGSLKQITTNGKSVFQFTKLRI